MTDRIVRYRVTASALAVVAVFSWLGFARAWRDTAGVAVSGVGVGLWLGVAVSATVFAAAAAAVSSVASLLRLQEEQAAVRRR